MFFFLSPGELVNHYIALSKNKVIITKIMSILYFLLHCKKQVSSGASLFGRHFRNVSQLSDFFGLHLVTFSVTVDQRPRDH